MKPEVLNRLQIRRPIVFTVLTAVMMAGMLTSCRKTDEIPPVNQQFTLAPDFSLKTLDGDTLSLLDLKNNVVVLYFLGYGCIYSKTSAPEIQTRLVVPYSFRSDYRVAGLDIWNGTLAEVESFRNATGFQVPLLMNASSVSDAFGIKIDRLVVIDQMGYIRFTGTRSAILDIDEVKSIVNKLFEQ
jgi:peroxiredoxin